MINRLKEKGHNFLSSSVSFLGSNALRINQKPYWIFQSTHGKNKRAMSQVRSQK